jgi:hypothetical protein
LSGSSHLTCLGWEALPVVYTTASIALGIMWPLKPHRYVKVGIIFENSWSKKTDFICLGARLLSGKIKLRFVVIMGITKHLTVVLKI